jgi:hypothetical protein
MTQYGQKIWSYLALNSGGIETATSFSLIVLAEVTTSEKTSGN